MKKTKRLFNRILSLLLVMVTITTTLEGCGIGTSQSPSVNDIDIEQIAQEIIEEVQDEALATTSFNDIVANGENLFLSSDWEDYVCDMETFTYGLISTQLKFNYNVFPACVDLSDGTTVYGIGYTDFEDCYTNEDESYTYCMAGLIPFVNELDIPEEDFNSGLELYNLDFESDNSSFILGYLSDPFDNHCVVYGQYLKYGVDDSNHIYYEYEDYSKDICDESLGSLYSYDEKKYLLDTNVGNYQFIDGVSLASEIDYVALEDEINYYLENQDINFASVDIDSCAYVSQEAVISYFLSLQQETFMGYEVQNLIKLAEELDPKECYQITSDGLLVLDIADAADEGESTLVKWLVGTGCVIVAAIGIVGAVVSIECPVLSAAFGALTGVAIEVFMEVVIESRSIENINWMKVATAAVTGAVSGFLGPYIMASMSGATYFIVDSALDGVLGAIEQAVMTWVEGGDADAILQSLGMGFVLGFGISAGFKGAATVVGRLLRGAGSGLNAIAERVAPNLKKNVGQFVTNIGNGITGKFAQLKRVADNSIFHSQYISESLMNRQLARAIANGDRELEDKAFNALRGRNIFDVDGNPITKSELQEIFKSAADNELIAQFKIGDEIVDIRKLNGMVGVFFDSSKYQSVTLDSIMLNDRTDTFERAAAKFKADWLENPDNMPASIRTLIEESGIELRDMEVSKLVDIIQSSDYVLHENIDLATVTLVSRAIHDKANETGVAHMGGYGLAKYLKEHMGVEYFDQFLSAAASGAIVVNY